MQAESNLITHSTGGVKYRSFLAKEIGALFFKEVRHRVLSKSIVAYGRREHCT